MGGSYNSSVTRVDNIDLDQLGKHFYALNSDSALHYVSLSFNLDILLYNSFQFNGFWKFNFPLKQMLVKSEREVNVKIVARVGELCSGHSEEGWAMVRVLEPAVNIRFVGPSNKVIDRELSFTTMVTGDYNTSWDLTYSLPDCGRAGEAGVAGEGRGDGGDQTGAEEW